MGSVTVVACIPVCQSLLKATHSGSCKSIARRETRLPPDHLHKRITSYFYFVVSQNFMPHFIHCMTKLIEQVCT